MSKPYALVNGSNVVTAVAQWDGVTPWLPPAGYTAVDVSAVTPIPGPGWIYNGSTFSPPAPPSPTLPPVAQRSAWVAQSYASSLQRKAAALQSQGKYAAATTLYLQAAGIKT